jgi:uncharacterized membrane protein YdbT with pleckstrin-like domain
MSAVVISERLLNEGERVIVSTRTHVKVLLGALLVLLVTVFALGYLAALSRQHLDAGPVRTTVWVVLVVVAVLVVVPFVVRPFLRWWTTSYTFTDRRFLKRSGLIAKQGRTIPLNRISGVDFEMGVVDRVFGCGTLVVSDASEDGRVPLRDIPDVENVQKRVADQLFHHTRGDHPGDDGT